MDFTCWIISLATHVRTRVRVNLTGAKMDGVAVIISAIPGINLKVPMKLFIVHEPFNFSGSAALLKAVRWNFIAHGAETCRRYAFKVFLDTEPITGNQVFVNVGNEKFQDWRGVKGLKIGIQV